jgi:hypothetical protein
MRKATPEEKAAKHQKRLEEARIARNVAKKLSGWRVAARIPASNGLSVHTVETDGHGNYKCTCQGFRIQKRGTCRHIDNLRS